MRVPLPSPPRQAKTRAAAAHLARATIVPVHLCVRGGGRGTISANRPYAATDPYFHPSLSFPPSRRLVTICRTRTGHRSTPRGRRQSLLCVCVYDFGFFFYFFFPFFIFHHFPPIDLPIYFFFLNHSCISWIIMTFRLWVPNLECNNHNAPIHIIILLFIIIV